MLPHTQELLKKSFTLYLKNKITILKFTGVLAIPLFITAVCKFLFTFSLDRNTPYLKLLSPALIVFVLYVFTLWATITLVRILSALYNRSDVNSVPKEFHASLPLVVPSLITIVLIACAIIGGLALLILPGIIFSIWFFFSVYSVVLDGKKGTNALYFSKSLISGKWWEVLWLLGSTTFLIVGSMLIVQTILHFLFTLLTQFSGNGTTLTGMLNILNLIISFVLNVLILPLSAAVPTILYNELKKLKTS